jgi:hypothetical protein
MHRVALRKHLLNLAVASILPLALLAGMGLLMLFQQQRTDAERKTLEITRALATAVDAELQRSVSALLAMSASDSLERGDIATFDNVARRALEHQPQWLSINLALPSGQQLANTRFALGEALPAIADAESLEAVVKSGQPQVGNLSQVRGRHAIAVRVPVMKGFAVRYVLTGVVDPASIVAIVSRQRVPDDWVISVFDAAGVRVARSRAHEQFLGTRPTQSLRTMLAGPADEGTGITTTLEGDTLFTAYTRLPASRWTVAMGLPADSVYLGALRNITVYGWRSRFRSRSASSPPSPSRGGSTSRWRSCGRPRTRSDVDSWRRLPRPTCARSTTWALRSPMPPAGAPRSRPSGRRSCCVSRPRGARPRPRTAPRTTSSRCSGTSCAIRSPRSPTPRACFAAGRTSRRSRRARPK